MYPLSFLICVALRGALDPGGSHELDPAPPPQLDLPCLLPSEVAQPRREKARDPANRAGKLQVCQETLRVPGRDIHQGSQNGVQRASKDTRKYAEIEEKWGSKGVGGCYE